MELATVRLGGRKVELTRMSPNIIVPIVVAPLIVWRLYYRMRRTFGRQPIRPKRTWARVGICVLVTLLAAGLSVGHPRFGAGLGVGVVGGAVLGVVALKLTRFEIDGHSDCYFPNPWIGLALVALFVGRLIYKVMAVWPEISHAADGAPTLPESPFTLLVLGLLMGYLIAYYAGLLLHHRRLLAMRLRLANEKPESAS
jgi:hypothetical protein